MEALRVFGLCAMATLAACVTGRDQGVDRLALTEANAAYDSALLHADAKALDHLYADDFRYFGPKGVERNKAQQIAALTSGDVDLLDGDSSDVDIRLYGATAVLTGKYMGRVRVSGREFAFTERYSTVWTNEKGSWRLVLEHGSVIEKP